jgi:hypothetical protein
MSTVSSSAMSFVTVTTTNMVQKISSIMLANNTTGVLATATVQITSQGVTHPLATGMNVDPQQPPAVVVDKANPIYMTGTQTLRGFASSTHVSVIVSYEELS